MQQIILRLTGRTPLVMHNVQLANPLNEHTVEIAKISKKRAKTHEDHALLADLEWRGGIYLTKVGKPGVPKGAIHRCLIEAARKSKLGKHFEQGVIPEDVVIPIDYTGPKTIEALSKDPSFRLTKPMTIQTRKVNRTRPFFEEWSIDVTFEFDPAVIDRDLFVETGRIAGRLIGILDTRQRGGGRFDVEEVV